MSSMISIAGRSYRLRPVSEMDVRELEALERAGAAPRECLPTRARRRSVDRQLERVVARCVPDLPRKVRRQLDAASLEAIAEAWIAQEAG